MKSMTGFGRAESHSTHGAIRVEIKTVNHKFLEISSRLPGHLVEFEDALRRVISQEIRRGKVSLFIFSPDPASYSAKLVLNESLAKEVSHKIQKLRGVLKLKAAGADPSSEEQMILREVLHYPDVLSRDTSFNQRTLYFKDIQKVLMNALANLKKSRTQEGAALERDLKGRIGEVSKALKIIEKRIPVLAGEYKKSLEKKLREFTKDGRVDAERLTIEVALYVKNSDISEEVTRLKSHMVAMNKTFRETAEIGRKIDFIAQEMQRESNTMGAKSSDVVIANGVIQIKSAIEKIREQTQNVE